MIQLDLALIGMIKGAYEFPLEDIVRAKTYREAVLLSWKYKRVKKMTFRSLAEKTGFTPQHISDYFAATDFHKNGTVRKQLPANRLAKYEAAVGNKFISQWLDYQSTLAIVEKKREEQEERMQRAA